MSGSTSPARGPTRRAAAAVAAVLLCVLVRTPIGLAAAGPHGEAAGASSGSALRLLALPVSTVASLGAVEPLADLGVRRTGAIPELGFWVLESDLSPAVATAGGGSRDPAEVLRLLQDSGRFQWVALAKPRRFSYVPDDIFWTEQWGPRAVGLPEVWDSVTGVRGVTVAVIDTGLNPAIPDFAGRIVHPHSVLTGDQNPHSWLDTLGHGTGAAAIAAATGDDGVGIAGAAWGVGVMPVKVGEGSYLDLVDEIAGVVWAVEHGASVINMSFGSTDESEAEKVAVRWALDRGAVVVAAAGNYGPAYGVEFPAAYAGVVSVGSVDRSEMRSSFSARGVDLDIVAPGEDVATWALGARAWEVEDREGTSFASPLVAGVAALMLSVNPDLGPADVEYILTRTAEDRGRAGRDDEYGWGLLDAEEAVAAATAWEPVAFPDVPPYHPYALSVVALSQADVVDGFGDGSFGPERRVTRQQFAKMILLSLGLTPTEEMISPFSDVTRSSTGLYPDHYVALAAELGITTGTSVDPPLFDPYGPITRAQMVTMAVRALDSTVPGGVREAPGGYRPPFGSFSPVHDPAATRAAWGGMLDGLEGMGGGYDMWAQATRGEVACVLAWVLERRTGLR
ncbi:MAG: S8 family peptidase [Thermoleophilia bacterium]